MYPGIEMEQKCALRRLHELPSPAEIDYTLERGGRFKHVSLQQHPSESVEASPYHPFFLASSNNSCMNRTSSVNVVYCRKILADRCRILSLADVAIVQLEQKVSRWLCRMESTL